MLNLRKVAVTGGLSCGKSTVCHFFKQLGAWVISADDIVHKLLSPKTDIGQKVIRLLGADIVVAHRLDRSKIAIKVFDDPVLLKSLENLLHPAVQEEIEKQYQQVNIAQLAQLFVAEVPLLFESGLDAFYDHTIAILANPKACQQRFQKTTGYDAKEYERRMKTQWNPQEKAKHADFVITNDGTLKNLKKTVEKIYNQLIGSSKLHGARKPKRSNTSSHRS